MRTTTVTKRVGDVEVSESETTAEDWERTADEARMAAADARASGRPVMGATQNGVAPSDSLLDAIYGKIPDAEEVDEDVDDLARAKGAVRDSLEALGSYMGTAVAAPLQDHMRELEGFLDHVMLTYTRLADRARRQDERLTASLQYGEVSDRLNEKALADLELAQERLSEAECAALGALAETASLKASIAGWVKHNQISERGWALVEKRAKRARKPYDDEAEAIVGNRRARAARASGRA